MHGGQHREKFGNEYGEIINGFLMSAPGKDLWVEVLTLICDMLETYPQRWREAVGSDGTQCALDKSHRYYTADVSLVGREGVLCLGPLAMTKVVFPFLKARALVETCLPKKFRHFFSFDTKTLKKGAWEKTQGALIWRDPARATAHIHYSNLTGPIVDLEFGPDTAAVALQRLLLSGRAQTGVWAVPIVNTGAASSGEGNVAQAIAAASSWQASAGARSLPTVAAERASSNRTRSPQCVTCQSSSRHNRQCSECGEWTCRPCGFWCTWHPKSEPKYTVCAHCQKRNRFLREHIARKVWLCIRCREGVTDWVHK